MGRDTENSASAPQVHHSTAAYLIAKRKASEGSTTQSSHTMPSEERLEYSTSFVLVAINCEYAELFNVVEEVISMTESIG